MNQSKGRLASKGWWGGVIALLPILDTLLVSTGVFGVPVLAEVGAEVITAFGVLLGLWGRVSANKTIEGWI